MKRAFLTIACLLLASVAWAGKGPPPLVTTTSVVTKHKTDPTLFLGLAWTFGTNSSKDRNGSLGLTLKVLSTNKDGSGAGVAGLTYNFGDGIGCDLGAALNDDGTALTATWDFCRWAPQLAIGAIKKEKTRHRIITVESPGGSGGSGDGT